MQFHRNYTKSLFKNDEIHFKECVFEYELNIHLCSVFIVDQDLSHIGDDDEAYDYKFVKWMIKEKVN